MKLKFDPSRPSIDNVDYLLIAFLEVWGPQIPFIFESVNAVKVFENTLFDFRSVPVGTGTEFS